MKKKRTDGLTREEILEIFKWRREHPLYVDSMEHDGVTLSFVNPELIETPYHEDETPPSKKKRPKKSR
jgi:hypothetical protein